jgi:signal transduction histidine kinase
LLRVHHGVILQVDENQPATAWKPLAGTMGWEVNVSLIEQSLASRRAASSSRETSFQNTHSVNSEALSELCVPISMRGKPVACLYVMHPEIRGLFREDEERLADFLATIAGAALENAEGFAELQELNATLERRVAERTTVLEARSFELAASNQELERIAQELRVAQVELSASKQAAEAASEAKSRFLATMSHEIRTPMNGILGMADLVLASPLSDRQRGYLETLKHSANALLTLLNDLLDFSKIEAGKMELEWIPFTLRDVVCDSTRLLAIPAGRKRLEFITRVSRRCPLLRDRRPEPLAASDREPDRQRHQIHSRRRSVRPRLAAIANARGSSPKVHDQGHRDRDPGRQAGIHLRSVSPNGQLGDQAVRRHRSRTGDHVAAWSN